MVRIFEERQEDSNASSLFSTQLSSNLEGQIAQLQSLQASYNAHVASVGSLPTQLGVVSASITALQDTFASLDSNVDQETLNSAIADAQASIAEQLGNLCVTVITTIVPSLTDARYINWGQAVQVAIAAAQSSLTTQQMGK